MKVLIVVSILVVAVAMAEPQRYRNTGYGAPEETNEAPYPPSGWRPSGRQFVLPARQASYYAPPPPAYGPPPSTEAPAPNATTTEAEPTTTDTPTTELPEEEDTNEFADGARAVSTASAQEQEEQGSGVYYVLLPDGRLQRVAYTTSPNGVPPRSAAPIRNAGYAQFQYMDVEPIRAPIYSYGAPLVRIF